MGKYQSLPIHIPSSLTSSYFSDEEEVKYGRSSRHGDIEYVADGMDYTESPGEGVEAASVEIKNIDAEEKVATNVMTRPVAERS
jgi:hypothetical protein